MKTTRHADDMTAHLDAVRVALPDQKWWLAGNHARGISSNSAHWHLHTHEDADGWSASAEFRAAPLDRGTVRTARAGDPVAALTAALAVHEEAP
jgi:hypothetical protein